MQQSHAPGAPVYLERQATRLGVPQRYERHCRNSPELHLLGTLIGHLVVHLRRDPLNPSAPPSLPPADVPRITLALLRLEEEVGKLMLAAAGGDDMVASAWKLFGIERPRLPFAIVADSDAPPPLAVEPEADVVPVVVDDPSTAEDEPEPTQCWADEPATYPTDGYSS